MRRLSAAMLAPVVLAVTSGLAGSALAENASATVLPGDRLHGNILTPGDEDRISVYLPAGALLSVDLRPDRDSALLPGLALEAPDGGDVPLDAHAGPGAGGVGVKVAKFPVGGTGGVFVLRVLAAEGGTGRYLLRTKVKTARTASALLSIPAAGAGTATVEAMAGSVAAYAVAAAKGSVGVVPAVAGFDGPEIPVPGTGGLRAKRLPLADDGVYTLTVLNQGEGDGDVTVRFTVKPPGASRRELFLSPTGFGEAPVLSSVLPDRVLDDRPAEDLEILGRGFAEGATLRLERKGEDPLQPTAFALDGDDRATASFDVTGVRAGAWSLVLENPSGGSGARKFTVQKAGKLRLPPGVVADTEVWWLEFDDATFPSDLALMGLGSTSSTVADLADAAVRQYVLYFVRRAFALTGGEGRVDDDASVPVCFVLEAPPSQVGAPGSTYNRLRIGGAALGGDPSSNPNYPWGTSPLDAGNGSFDDVSRDAGPGLGILARALAPSGDTGTDAWKAALAPLLTTPLTAGDAVYFAPNFVPADEAQGTRYRHIVTAVRAVGRELGGTVAHFVARSMGLADGATGLAAVPAEPGEYFSEVNFGFSEVERTALRAVARVEGLPGVSKTLVPTVLPARETRPYLLPAATSTEPYNQAFAVAGGRPDADGDDLVFTGIAGSIPAGFSLSDTGVVSGTAPLFVPGQGRALHGGVFRFLVRLRDLKTGDDIFFSHRINLLVDADNPALSPAEMLAAQTLNGQTLAEP